MIALLYFTIASSFLAGFVDLIKFLGPIGRVIPLLPEAGSFLLLVGILLHLGSRKDIALSPKYVVLGILITIHLVFGLIINWTTSGTVISGIRDYYRFVPLFLLPAVVVFTREDLSKILRFCLLMCVFQVPVAIYQRVFIYPFIPSGDVVRGTLDSGAINSVLIVAAITILSALWVRRTVKLQTVLILSGLIMVPMLINETKASIILFAFAMTCLAVFSSTGLRRLITLSATGMCSILFIFVFAAAYDYFYPDNYGGVGLIEFYSERAISNEYLGIDDPNEVREVPRIDSIVLAYRELKDDPLELLFGLGMGNVSHPSRNEILAGGFSEYYALFNIDRTTYTQALWEIGMLGLFLIGLLTVFVFRDARSISKLEGLNGSFGLAWTAIMAFLPLAILYKSLIHSAAAVVLLMFFSGYIASMRVRISHEERRTTIRQQSSGGTGPMSLGRDKSIASAVKDV